MSDAGALIRALGQPLDDRVVQISWLGQSGFVVRGRAACVLIDPYLSDSLTTKYAGTDRPHVRMYPRVVAPDALAALPLTAILCTHHHTDHIDPETLRPLVAGLSAAGRSVPIVAPEAWRELAAERAGVAPDAIVGIDEEGTTRMGDVEVEAIAAAHEVVEHDARGRRKCLGYLVRLSGATIYHSGDTMVYEGLAARVRAAAVDVALLPINGKVGNMSGREAARLAHDAAVRLVVPCHYDMFEFNTADPAAEFIPECEPLGQTYRVLQIGESMVWP